MSGSRIPQFDSGKGWDLSRHCPLRWVCFSGDKGDMNMTLTTNPHAVL